MDKDKLIDKIEYIQDKNWNIYPGSNEYQLATRVDIADHVESLFEQEREISNPVRQNIFNYFADEHDLLLMDGDFNELQRFLKEPNAPKKPEEENLYYFLEDENGLWLAKGKGFKLTNDPQEADKFKSKINAKIFCGWDRMKGFKVTEHVFIDKPEEKKQPISKKETTQPIKYYWDDSACKEQIEEKPLVTMPPPPPPED